MLRKLHLASGLIISIFVAMHLFNHYSAILGAEAHIQLMEGLRLIYRSTIIEIVLLSAVLLQIFSGLKLFFVRFGNTRTAFEKLHIWSGLYLAFFLVVHVGAVLGGRFVLELDTNFYFGIAGLNTFPFSLFFIPYYGLAILSFFGHIAAIHEIKMKTVVLGLNPKKQSCLILVVGLFLTLFVLYALTNGFDGVEIPETYHILIGK